jgi:hypothetical protein
MEIAYVFHAASCALLLDSGGVCRWVLAKTAEPDDRVKRCVGAQFVASLDPEVEGLLGHEPTIGKNVVFARVDAGRISLVRFGPIVKVERIDIDDSAPAETVRVPAVAQSELDANATTKENTAVPHEPTVVIEEDSESTLERPAARIELDDFEDLATAVPTSALRLDEPPPLALTKPRSGGMLPRGTRLN